MNLRFSNKFDIHVLMKQKLKFYVKFLAAALFLLRKYFYGK